MSSPTRNPVPARTAQQRADALASGNRIRSARAVIRRELHAGRADPLRTLRDHPEVLATMQVQRFVTSIRWVGPVRAAILLRTLKISPAKTIGGLTPCQRVDLEWALSKYTGSSGAAAQIAARP